MCVPRVTQLPRHILPRGIGQRDASWPGVSCAKLGHAVGHDVSLSLSLFPARCPSRPANSERREAHISRSISAPTICFDPERADPTGLYRVEPRLSIFAKKSHRNARSHSNAKLLSRGMRAATRRSSRTRCNSYPMNNLMPDIAPLSCTNGIVLGTPIPRRSVLIIITHSSLYFEIKMRQRPSTRIRIQERRANTEFGISVFEIVFLRIKFVIW